MYYHDDFRHREYPRPPQALALRGGGGITSACPPQLPSWAEKSPPPCDSPPQLLANTFVATRLLQSTTTTTVTTTTVPAAAEACPRVTFSAEKVVDLDAAKMWAVFGNWASIPEYKGLPGDLMSVEGDGGIGSTVTMKDSGGFPGGEGLTLIEEVTALDDKAMTLKYKMNEFGVFPILAYECTMQVTESQGGACVVSWSGSAAYNGHDGTAAEGEEAWHGKDSFVELMDNLYDGWITAAADMAKAS